MTAPAQAAAVASTCDGPSCQMHNEGNCSGRCCCQSHDCRTCGAKAGQLCKGVR